MGFQRLIDTLFRGKKNRLPVNGKDLKRLSSQNEMFNLPIDQWRITPCSYSITVKQKYCEVTDHFEQALSYTFEIKSQTG